VFPRKGGKAKEAVDKGREKNGVKNQIRGRGV
jgi:hypothetical protein